MSPSSATNLSYTNQCVRGGWPKAKRRFRVAFGLRQIGRICAPFRRLPTTPCTWMQHGCNMGGPETILGVCRIFAIKTVRDRAVFGIRTRLTPEAYHLPCRIVATSKLVDVGAKQPRRHLAVAQTEIRVFGIEGSEVGPPSTESSDRVASRQQDPHTAITPDLIAAILPPRFTAFPPVGS